MHRKRIFSILNNASKPVMIGAAFFAGYALAHTRVKINPPVAKQRVFLIDWDNCLCDSTPRIVKRLNLVATELKRRHPHIEIDAAKLLLPCTGELSSHLRNVFGDSYAKEATTLYMEYMNHQDIPPKRPFEGAADFLQTVKESEIPFAIVSNATVKIVQQGIDYFAWNELLLGVPIITVDHVNARNKPDPYHFLAAVDSLNINLNSENKFEITIIGDGLDSDMLGALKLADQIVQPNIAISAIWINHNRPVSCQLNAVSNFADAQQLLFSKPQSNVSKAY